MVCVVGRVTLLLVWEIKAWIKTATRDARLCMLNPVSNAVSLSPSWAAKFLMVLYGFGDVNWEDYSWGFLKLVNFCSSSLLLNFHVEVNPDP